MKLGLISHVFLTATRLNGLHVFVCQNSNGLCDHCGTFWKAYEGWNFVKCVNEIFGYVIQLQSDAEYLNFFEVLIHYTKE